MTFWVGVQVPNLAPKPPTSLRFLPHQNHPQIWDFLWGSVVGFLHQAASFYWGASTQPPPNAPITSDFSCKSIVGFLHEKSEVIEIFSWSASTSTITLDPTFGSFTLLELTSHSASQRSQSNGKTLPPSKDFWSRWKYPPDNKTTHKQPWDFSWECFLGLLQQVQIFSSVTQTNHK